MSILLGKADVSDVTMQPCIFRFLGRGGISTGPKVLTTSDEASLKQGYWEDSLAAGHADLQ